MVKKAHLNTSLGIMMMIRPLCIKLTQMIGHIKCFDSNKTISFKVNDKKLLKKSILKYGKESTV